MGTYKNDGRSRLIDIFLVSLKLGCTSFGGPTAHIGYFHNEYVKKKKWLDEREFSELIALCQLLPGPASSQAGFGIGLKRGGVAGGIASFAGFTFPSFALMALFAFYLSGLASAGNGWLHGLKIVAAAVVLQAVYSLGKSFATKRETATIAFLAAAGMFVFPNSLAQLAIMAASGAAGYLFCNKTAGGLSAGSFTNVSKKFAVACLAIFCLLFVLLPAIRSIGVEAELADSFYRSGALVFGGGHVVLPLLERELVPTGFISKENFLAGYGLVQAMPGPLFTFSAYLGAAVHGWTGAIIAIAAIFLPGFLLLLAVLPFWEKIRTKPSIQSVVAGLNAGVVGLLAAAFYDPIFVSSITSRTEAALFALFFGLLAFWKIPPWLLVVLGAGAGYSFL
ncbi:chromate transporter [Neobacillus piezotolerans]|uniref:Chromate transporter n=1 Tax=Neobacillus piezotolerans TaxID=2259171 RepID=A0A3D8GN14_9BACI|nr:chromate efflux transporter [Neobacillus piezotolerans]RDU35853.1 chromate transporter [Neobacillus piezotolerans]